jgi:hypothetical protein
VALCTTDAGGIQQNIMTFGALQRNSVDLVARRTMGTAGGIQQNIMTFGALQRNSVDLVARRTMGTGGVQ